jgi:hypothetical protein
MGGKKQSRHQLGQTTFAVLRVQMTTLELDLLSSMSFERPLALFVANAAEMDTLKCPLSESWVGVGLKTSASGTITSDVLKFVAGIGGTLRFQARDTLLAMTLLDNVEIQSNKLVAFVKSSSRNWHRWPTSLWSRLGISLVGVLVAAFKQWWQLGRKLLF